MSNWQKGEPDKHGYYLAAWRDGPTELVVSELWYNPDSVYHWWFSRGYAGQHRGGLADAVRYEVVAWMPMPEPPTI
jgi:hypothetical protein